jgi:hypothetical protein
MGNGSKAARHEDGHSYLSDVKVKHARNYTSTPPYVLMAWCLIKQGEHFTYNCILSVNNGV